MWLTEVANIAEADRVYVDEMGCDDRVQREYGWSPCGEPCVDQRAGHARERLSVVAAWQSQSQPQSQPQSSSLMAALSFDGTCHHRLFEVWLRLMLCPLLRPGQVVILDNARFHRKAAVQRQLRRAGCRALFLPSYSPDLNPIEHQWHACKTRVRTHRAHGMEFKQAFEAALL